MHYRRWLERKKANIHSTLVKPITALYYIAGNGVTWALIFSGFLFIFFLYFVVMGLWVWIWGSGVVGGFRACGIGLQVF